MNHNGLSSLHNRIIFNIMFLSRIQLGDSGMLVCSADYCKVYICALDGKVLKRCGHKGYYGGPGELSGPILCHVDFEGSSLIADSGNGRIQVRSQSHLMTLIFRERFVYQLPSALVCST